MRSVSLPVRKIDFVPPFADNSCGPCTACCDIVAVGELGKPHYARCAHLGANCGIYDHRPSSCRTWRCVWHMGLFGDRPDWRPDKLGLMFGLNTEGEGGLRIDVMESVPGALEANRDRLKFIYARLRSHKSFKNVLFPKVWVFQFPYGADIPPPHPIAETYQPFHPADLKFTSDAAKGEATFQGNRHGLLQPHASSTRPVLAAEDGAGQPQQ